jgi:hypothetical protein
LAQYIEDSRRRREAWNQYQERLKRRKAVDSKYLAAVSAVLKVYIDELRRGEQLRRLCGCAWRRIPPAAHFSPLVR